MTLVSGTESSRLWKCCCGLHSVIYMAMNLFDIILLAASHPATQQQRSEILPWMHVFVEVVEMLRLSLKHTTVRLSFMVIFIQSL